MSRGRGWETNREPMQTGSSYHRLTVPRDLEPGSKYPGRCEPTPLNISGASQSSRVPCPSLFHFFPMATEHKPKRKDLKHL